jgi:hypothetical protein
MEPVAGEVNDNDHLHSLVEPRLAAKRTEALKQIFKRSGTANPEQRKQHDGYRDLRYWSGDQHRKKPIDQI